MKGAQLPGLEGGLEVPQSTGVRGQEQAGDREAVEFGSDMLTRGHVSDQPAEFGGLCLHHEGGMQEDAGRRRQPGWTLPISSFISQGRGQGSARAVSSRRSHRGGEWALVHPSTAGRPSCRPALLSECPSQSSKGLKTRSKLHKDPGDRRRTAWRQAGRGASAVSRER